MAAIKPQSYGHLLLFVRTHSFAGYSCNDVCHKDYINFNADILFAALAASFRGVNGKSFRVPFYLEFLINFAAEILFDVQLSASNTKLNDMNMYQPFHWITRIWKLKVCK